jgi:hypothetical protein
VRTRQMWEYKDRFNHNNKNTWVRNGVAMCTKVQSYVRTRNE